MFYFPVQIYYCHFVYFYSLHTKNAWNYIDKIQTIFSVTIMKRQSESRGNVLFRISPSKQPKKENENGRR